MAGSGGESRRLDGGFAKLAAAASTLGNNMKVPSFWHAAAGTARFYGTPARIDKALLIYNNGSARKWRNWQTRQT